MKIRTINDLQDAIDAEMGWRKRELSAVKANIQSARNFAKDTALRSGVTLLYAHWEGAIKNIAEFYLMYVSSLKLPYSDLKFNFLALSVSEKTKLFSETKKSTLHTKIVGEIFDLYSSKSQIPYSGIIKTNSNLNSEVFVEIMSVIGLETDKYETNFQLIDTVLLNMRNKIAHGEKLASIDLDEKRYNEIHDKIFTLIDMFSVQVLNAAVNKEYLKR